MKVFRQDEGSVRVFAVMFVNDVMQRDQSSVYICVWWDINGNNDGQSKLPGPVEGSTKNRQIFQMWRAGTGQD